MLLLLESTKLLDCMYYVREYWRQKESVMFLIYVFGHLRRLYHIVTLKGQSFIKEVCCCRGVLHKEWMEDRIQQYIWCGRKVMRLIFF
jgi:hypothetical protein